MLQLCELLHLKPGLTKYEVTVGSIDGCPPISEVHGSATLHIVPRSTVQATFYMSHGVFAPAEHVECGIVTPIPAPDDHGLDWTHITDGLFTVHACKQLCRPKGAWIAIKYRDYWYYIDDRDRQSKITFTLMMVMWRANLLATKKGSPVLTLPVGR
jgi:hypothetical protein